MNLNLNPAALMPAGFGGYVQALQTTRPKRYVVGVELWVNMPVTVKGVTYSAKAPADRRLRVYRTYDELMARKNAVVINVSTGIKMPVELFASTLLKLSTVEDPAVFLRDNRFNVKLYYNNQQYWYTYEPKEGILLYMSSTDPATADKLRQLANLELQMKQVLAAANRNATALAQLGKNLHPQLRAQYNQAVVKHNATVNQIKNSTPPEMKFVLTQLQPAAVSGNAFIGLAPIVIIALAAVGLVGNALLAYGATKIATLITDTIRHKNNLDLQYKTIEQMVRIDQQYKAGQLTPEGYKKIMEQAQGNLESSRTMNEGIQTSSGKSLFDEAKTLLIWGAGAVLAVKILPSLFNKSNGKV